MYVLVFVRGLGVSPQWRPAVTQSRYIYIYIYIYIDHMLLENFLYLWNVRHGGVSLSKR